MWPCAAKKRRVASSAGRGARALRAALLLSARQWMVSERSALPVSLVLSSQPSSATAASRPSSIRSRASSEAAAARPDACASERKRVLCIGCASRTARPARTWLRMTGRAATAAASSSRCARSNIRLHARRGCTRPAAAAHPACGEWQEKTEGENENKFTFLFFSTRARARQCAYKKEESRQRQQGGQQRRRDAPSPSSTDSSSLSASGSMSNASLALARPTLTLT